MTADCFESSDLDSILSVRPSCKRVFDYVAAGLSQHFELHLDKLDKVAELVGDLTKERYPTGVIPYHSRMRHFPKEMLSSLDSSDRSELSKRLFDLVTVSVLLDAGAGATWKFVEGNQSFNRSEGLGVASLVLFKKGFFSTSPENLPLQVNSERLMNLTLTDFTVSLQVSVDNPLKGIEGRFELLRHLGRRLKELQLDRPCDLLVGISDIAETGCLQLPKLWKFLFFALATIWPKKDIWLHSSLGIEIPFHKLFQWLLYSYVEVLEISTDFTVSGKELQTGLPEYRNGGLFVDMGVLEVKQKKFPGAPYSVDSELVVEWRACTVVLLDLLKEKKFPGLPLCCMLEGGTWVAGRKIAATRREGGDSPIPLLLDGTIF